MLQREGRLKYAITGGQYRAYNNSVEKTPFGQLTGIYGLPQGLTLYGGVQDRASTGRSPLGWVKHGDFGAISTDVTQPGLRRITRPKPAASPARAVQQELY